MTSLTDGLPPEIAREIDPNWRKNEAAYWDVRDQLLRQYQGQWIGFADGAVIASGASPVAVFHAAEATGRNPFVTCVGHENEPTRMRRVSFAYDGSYPGEPLPILTAEFRPVSGSPGLILDRIIADTGADAARLPWADCQGLRFGRQGKRARPASHPSVGLPGLRPRTCPSGTRGPVTTACHRCGWPQGRPFGSGSPAVPRLQCLTKRWTSKTSFVCSMG